jgi:hypothetical protein
MSIFESKKIEVSNVRNATVTIGERNIVTVSQRISEVKETNITNEGKKWEEVVNQITALQKVLREVPDESEEVRDLELIPSTARAKSEAMKLRENPKGEKKGFLDNFKAVCDSVVKVAGLATTVSPIIVGIANLIGIPIPPLPT